uniref:Uncharacterized protein n=1 Tax=Setaria viridis TaxID=4556 RepID=A0A4U6SZ22_SETVI|nr:hypothetical protein SEVIR_9G295301v2 [Setaria viridis]
MLFAPFVCQPWMSSSSSTHSMSATICSREAVPRSRSSTSYDGCALGVLHRLWTLSRRLQQQSHLPTAAAPPTLDAAADCGAGGSDGGEPLEIWRQLGQGPQVQH